MTFTRENRHTRRRQLAIGLLAAAATLSAAIAPAAAGAKGYVEEEVGLGYFYSTFDEDPNIALLVGGPAEAFCEDNPDDPFNAEPGSTTQRLYFRSDGSLDIKTNDKDQPIYLYEIEFDGAPPWIEQVCETYFDDGTAPDAFAVGSADLKVRVTIGDGTVDVFNSVNGHAAGEDGRYRVRASADLLVVDGDPQGNPADFVSLELKRTGR